MNIILAGMPACGKTTVARALGKLLNLNVVDTDSEIVKKYGAINDIFESYGEEAFRNLETEIVKAVCRQNGVVVSTGGGCLLREQNVDLFKASGKIVYLRTRLETLLKRVEGDFSRPLLKGGAKEKMTALYEKRTPVYGAAADYTVDTDGFTPEQIAKTVCEIINLK